MFPIKYIVPCLLLFVLSSFSTVSFGCGELDWREDDWNQGGRNENEISPGSGQRGQLLDGQVVIDDEGRFAVAATDEGKTYALDLENGTAKRLNVSINPRRVAFGMDNRAVFTESGNYLAIVDLEDGNLLRKIPISQQHKYLSVNDKRDKLICWGEEFTAVLIDLESEKMTSLAFDEYIWDIRWNPIRSEWLVVHHAPFEDSDWKKFDKVDRDESRLGSKISFFSSKSPNKIKEVLVPNCAASMEISPDGSLGMLAPTWCHPDYTSFTNPASLPDPVSMIDLKNHRYIETIPGFGPVDFAPSGEYALAFGRKNTLNDMTGILTDSLYSLMFLYPETRHTDIVNLGAILPLYTITPDSHSVLIYSKESVETGIWVVDAETKILSKVDGPNLSLSKYVMGTTNEITYLADDGLYLLDAQVATLEFVPVDCLSWFPNRTNCNPNRIGILPDRTRLVLGYDNPMDFLVYDIADQAIIEAYRVESDDTSLETGEASSYSR